MKVLMLIVCYSLQYVVVRIDAHISQKKDLREATNDLKNSIEFITGNIKGCKVHQLSLDDETYGKGDISECVPYPDGTIGSRCLENDELLKIEGKQMKFRRKRRNHQI